MIRFADENDLPQIINLWNSSFPEDKSFGEWFFDKTYKPENTLVYETDGKIISMLQRIPYEIKNIGAVTYIFGACTQKDFRGKGIMAELIDYSEKIDRNNGIKASILIPQQKGLFDFYAKFGYSPEFKISSKIFTNQNEMDHSFYFAECSSEDIEKLNNLYETTLADTNYVVRDFEYWKEQIEMFNSLGGKVFCLNDKDRIVSYAFVWNDESVVIQELLGMNKDVKKILCNKITDFYDIEKVKVFSLAESSESYDFGCIKLYGEKVNELPYIMNLMYN